MQLDILMTNEMSIWLFGSLGGEDFGEKRGWSGKNERLCERILEDLFSS